MSSFVPIPASVQDTFYRYKREVVRLVPEHKNGIQHRLANLENIARQLKVEHEDLIRHLRKHLKCHISNGVIPGKMEVPTVEAALEVYIVEHVLCPKCQLPELVTRHGDTKCNACGNSKEANFESKKGSFKKVDSTSTSDDMDMEPSPEDSGSTSLDIKTCNIMHQIYDLRDHYIDGPGARDPIAPVIIQRAEELLKKCWNCKTEEEYKKIKKRIAEFGAEIDSGQVAPPKFVIVPKPVSAPDLSCTVKKPTDALEKEKLGGSTLIRSASAVDVTRKSMMLRKGKPARLEDVFQLPLGQGTLNCSEMLKMYPDFGVGMDGTTDGASLLLYYDRNPLTGIYELRDADAEHDISEELGMNLEVAMAGESAEDELARKTRDLSLREKNVKKSNRAKRPAETE